MNTPLTYEERKVVVGAIKARIGTLAQTPTPDTITAAASLLDEHSLLLSALQKMTFWIEPTIGREKTS